MEICLLAAVARNGVIGANGALPWHLPNDLRRFRKLTMGYPIIMGSKTYTSIGRPLPGRITMVISRTRPETADGPMIVRSLDQALTLSAGHTRTFIVGGAEIYRLALPRCQRMFLTRIDAGVDGDVLFPVVEWSEWQLIDLTHHPADERHMYPYSFGEYVRCRAQPSEG